MTAADLEGLPELPYAGTSGYASGSPSSEARARHDDEAGITSKRQRAVVTTIRDTGSRGMTWREVADRFGWHHGQASGVLSGLHMTRHLARLTERRHRCAVYVVPEHVEGRDTEPHGGKRRTEPTPFEWWGPEPDHTDGSPSFRACPTHRDALDALPFPMALAAAVECPRCESWNTP